MTRNFETLNGDYILSLTMGLTRRICGNTYLLLQGGGVVGMMKNPVDFLQPHQHTLEFLKIFERTVDALQDFQ